MCVIAFIMHVTNVLCCHWKK